MIKALMWSISFKYWITGCTPLLECSQSTYLRKEYSNICKFQNSNKTCPDSSMMPACPFLFNYQDTGRWWCPQLYKMQHLQHYNWFCEKHCWGLRETSFMPAVLYQFPYLCSTQVTKSCFFSIIRSLIPSRIWSKMKSNTNLKDI